MYDVYLDFLQEFDEVGTKSEFEKLNGPSLKEIISFLKNKYNIRMSEDKLLEKYDNFLEQSYQNVKPFQESFSILQYLKEKNYKLALVSSASEKIVKNILKKNNWIEFFSLIVTGDDIKKSKPSPEIYNLCLSRCKANAKKILVIEDSKNGYVSAKNAGLNCILLDKNINLKSLISIC